MLASVAASAAAARALGYRGLADLIEQESLPPRAIARLFAMTGSRGPRASGCARDCAVVLLSGALGRYRACAHGWEGEDERQLALAALSDEPDPAAVLARLSIDANRIVSKHWPEIAPAA
jgi:hypothetical protein